MERQALKTKTLLPLVTELCHKAGDAILAVYQKKTPVRVETKTDHSPVTQADKKAHDILYEGLSQLQVFEGDGVVPVLSEEGEALPYFERKKWHTYWLVDPLDGTKEFLGRTDEFTVNIALIQDNEPVFGMVYVPCQKALYYAIKGEGAFKQAGNGVPCSIHTKPYVPKTPLRVLVSRRHARAELSQFFPKSLAYEITHVGSALKMCLIAEGKADCYPRLGPTSEWDTAASHCILREAGGEIFDLYSKPLSYNQKDSLLNPPFLAVGDRDFDWPFKCQ